MALNLSTGFGGRWGPVLGGAGIGAGSVSSAGSRCWFPVSGVGPVAELSAHMPRFNCRAGASLRWRLQAIHAFSTKR